MCRYNIRYVVYVQTQYLRMYTYMKTFAWSGRNLNSDVSWLQGRGRTVTHALRGVYIYIHIIACLPGKDGGHQIGASYFQFQL